jgi:endonuclease IV
MIPMRVRAILDGADAQTKTDLKKMLPLKLKMPDAETLRYPNALLTALPKESAYSALGCIAEDFLCHSVDEMTVDTLLEVVKSWITGISADSLAKIQRSVTTPPFIEACKETRRQMDAILVGTMKYDQELVWDKVVGHPDGLTDTQVFEVKLTGQLKQGWTGFLLQTFAYAALAPSVKTVCIVLPLQQTVWKCDVSGWKHRTQFRDRLNTVSKRLQQNAVNDAVIGTALRETYKIGFHVAKQPSISDTVGMLPDYSKPYQIFLGSTQSSHLSISDEQIAHAASAIIRTRAKLYVHTPYLINLSQPVGEWGTALLIKNVQYSVAIGCRGVVVHVGKSTDKPLATALENMRGNLLAAMEHATTECPVLLETPAGQGTETLKDMNEFIAFVAGFNDPRLRMCIDTCHVFSCGHKPLEYLEKATGGSGGSGSGSSDSCLVKLVHYNDSAAPCGACVDRHAFMGTGHLGMDSMAAIAKFCGEKGLPMVIE